MSEQPPENKTESLADREARLRAILESSVQGIITIDERGRILSMNLAAETLFGYKECDAIGKNVSMLMPEPYESRHDGYIANYLTTGDKKIIGIGREVVGKRRDGKVFPIHLAVSEVTLSTGRIFTGFIHDLTERNRLQEQIIQSERLAAIGEAMAGLAHESRNALQRSQACVDLLENSLGDNPRYLDWINGIQRAQDELQRLYEGVRNYSAPIQLKYESADLSAIVHSAWSDTLLLRKDRNVVFHETTQCEHCQCEVDAQSMKQVFRNLFENALQACDDPVEISVKYSQDDAQRCIITARDNGPGIPTANQDRVFESFFTTKTIGTGLGLAVARRIVASHGGEIAIESEYENGAGFRIVLPVRVVGD